MGTRMLSQLPGKLDGVNGPCCKSICMLPLQPNPIQITEGVLSFYRKSSRGKALLNRLPRVPAHDIDIDRMVERLLIFVAMQNCCGEKSFSYRLFVCFLIASRRRHVR